MLFFGGGGSRLAQYRDFLIPAIGYISPTQPLGNVHCGVSMTFNTFLKKSWGHRSKGGLNRVDSEVDSEVDMSQIIRYKVDMPK